MAAPVQASVDSLRGIPIFATCSTEGLASIAAALESVQVATGDAVFREGDPGDEMYIVEAGQVRVVSDVETEKVVFAHLGLGEFFGEMSLLTGAPRSAAVIATSDAHLWRLRRTDFERIEKERPEVSVEINRILGERVVRGNAQRFENEAFTLLTLTPERQEVMIASRRTLFQQNVSQTSLQSVWNRSLAAERSCGDAAASLTCR